MPKATTNTIKNNIVVIIGASKVCPIILIKRLTSRLYNVHNPRQLVDEIGSVIFNSVIGGDIYFYAFSLYPLLYIKWQHTQRRMFIKHITIIPWEIGPSEIPMNPALNPSIE